MNKIGIGEIQFVKEKLHYKKNVIYENKIKSVLQLWSVKTQLLIGNQTTKNFAIFLGGHECTDNIIQYQEQGNCKKNIISLG